MSGSKCGSISRLKRGNRKGRKQRSIDIISEVSLSLTQTLALVESALLLNGDIKTRKVSV